MSYDFELFRRRLDERRAPAGVPEGEEQQGATEPFAALKLGSLSKDEVKRKLADLLISTHSAFREFEKDYKRIAQTRSITEAEARHRYSDIELTDDEGLQVTLFDDTAAVTMPFWPNSEQRLRTAWECLKILESAGLFSTYDQQIGRNLDLECDFEVVRASYIRANRIVNGTLRKRP